jgi:signal peptidase I
VRCQLITDFSPYNRMKAEPRRRSYSHPGESFGLGEFPGAEGLGLHWVGDLILECTVRAEQAEGQFVMALVKAGTFFRCEIDLATGKATLSIDGLDQFHPSAATRCRGPGEHRVRFANVDQRLLLWIDGSPVWFDSTTSYWPMEDSRPQAADLQPARIGSRHAALRVSHLRLFRDIYYIAQRGAGSSPMSDYDTSAGEFPYLYGSEDIEEKFAEFFSTPAAWDVFKQRRQVEFPLSENQFLVLGDNSAESMDSRLWEQRGPQYFVDRDLLIGKALFIYWPHSHDVIPGTQGLLGMRNGVWFPFFPNFGRMGPVR